MPSPITITAADLTFEKNGAPVSKVFQFEGQLDESNIDDQAAVLTEVIAALEKGAFAIFDLSKLTYLNSKSVGYVTFWHVKLQHRGGEVVLAAVPQNIIDILNVVGITQIMKVFTTVEEAQNYIAQQIG